jgi:hypothetical protein
LTTESLNVGLNERTVLLLLFSFIKRETDPHLKSSDTDRVYVDRPRRRRLQLPDLEGRRAVVLRREEKRRNLRKDGPSDVNEFYNT